MPLKKHNPQGVWTTLLITHLISFIFFIAGLEYLRVLDGKYHKKSYMSPKARKKEKQKRNEKVGWFVGWFYSMSISVRLFNAEVNLFIFFIFFWKQWQVSKSKVGDLSGGWPKAPFSIATSPRRRIERYSILWIAPLYSWTLPYNAEC